MGDEQENGKVIPGEFGDSGEKQDDPVNPDENTEQLDPDKEEAAELAEFSIALSLMPDGRVMFLKPDLPSMRKANDEDILSLLERGKRQLERMITISTVRASIQEGVNMAANIGGMSAMKYMAEQAKGSGIITP